MSSASHQLPSTIVAKEFGEVNVRDTGAELQVIFTIMMEPQGKEAEGWQTGVALDASASMKSWFGRNFLGKVPPAAAAEYESRGWLKHTVEDGRRVRSFKKEAYEDAFEKGYLKYSANIVEPLAREFIAYLAGNLDADGGTTVIYWACSDGSKYEVLGDFTEEQCRELEIVGPRSTTFGAGTTLTPAVRYFADRFAAARRGMYVFITDGRLDDLAEVKAYTAELAREIASGRRNPLKCVLIGVGDKVDEEQMEQLDDLDTGTDVDIWDHKIASDMRGLVEIFAEVVDESLTVAPTGTIYDSSGSVAKVFTDGVPGRISVTFPRSTQWFELEVFGKRVRQPLTFPKVGS